MFKVHIVDEEFMARDGLLSFEWGTLEKLLKQSLPIAINIFWKELTNGTLDDEVEIVEKMNLLGISFQSSYFACAIFNINTPPTSKPKVTSKGVYPDTLYVKLRGYLNAHQRTIPPPQSTAGLWPSLSLETKKLPISGTGPIPRAAQPSR